MGYQVPTKRGVVELALRAAKLQPVASPRLRTLKKIWPLAHADEHRKFLCPCVERGRSPTARTLVVGTDQAVSKVCIRAAPHHQCFLDASLVLHDKFL